MSSDPDWTIGRLLQWTTDYFKRHDSETPRLDAEVLLAAAVACQRIELYTTYDQIVADAPRARFRELVRRRAAGEPVAYLVGHREFYSLPFRITPDVLIPRPETELLVVKLLDAVADSSVRAARIVDVGTGSGAVALSIARQLRDCRVTAIDISPAALEVARSNAETLGVADRVVFTQSDLLESLAGEMFDFVVSNPPYVSSAEFDELPNEVRQYEPQTALLAGDTGTEVIERLVPQAATHLQPGGSLFVEISPMIEQQVKGIFQDEPRFEDETTYPDLAGHARVVTARRV